MILNKIKKLIFSKNKLKLVSNYMYVKKRKKLCKKTERSVTTFGVKPKVIVSLTTFPPRFNQVPLMLKSILLQSYKPDMIVVWLDVSPEMITPEMRALEKYGITYRFNVENLRAHKKYFFALQEFSDSIVITVDDDVVYPKDMIKSLVKTWEKYPECICARRVHKITFNDDGSIKPYNDWIMEYKGSRKPSLGLTAIGVGGVLYPPHIFDDKVFDVKQIKHVAFGNDDIWLKWSELRLNVKVVWAKNHMIHPATIEGSQTVSLSSDNVVRNQNDVMIRTAQEEVFKFSESLLEK